MMGRNHLIVGACALEHAYVASTLIDRSENFILTDIQSMTWHHMGLTDPSWFVIPVYLAAYFLGNLLPDIDNPDSILGRIIHIPVKHRTWFHAVYLYLILALFGWYIPVFAWTFAGVFVHLFWDSLSACGNCWFYKLFSDYIEYPNDAKIKKGHKLKLYHAGEWSEYLVVFINVVVTAVSFIKIRGWV